MRVPFVKSIGINDDKLENKKSLQNHMGSIHAGAIFTFAENASGEYLSSQFPDLKDRVIPLLRESSIKYKKEARSSLKSEVSIDEIEKFKAMLEKKGRGVIVVCVRVIDERDDIVAVCSFKWYIQKL